MVLKLLRAYVCVVVLLLCFSGPARAQTPTTIAGTVQDSSGGAVVGVAINLLDDKGAISQTAVTDDQGAYLFAGLTPGTYTISVSVQGFKDLKVPGLVLAAGQSLRQDLALVAAEVVTSTTVEGQVGAAVETEQSQIAGTITQKELVNLGLNGRNFTQLIALAPGVTNQTGQDEAKVGVQGSVKYSVNGGRVEYNNFEVDGVDVLNAGINGSQSTLIVYPSLDALGEVQVLTSNYGAQYGKTASGTILASVKTGTPQFHGDLYYFNRNEIFNARNFFDETSHAPLYRKNDIGATLGGPLRIPWLMPASSDPKTFFFISEEGRLEKDPTGFTYNRGVPSLAERQGNFNDVCPKSLSPAEFARSAYPDCPSTGINQINPATGGPLFATYAQNNVPIDPVAQAILDAGLIPLANSTSGCNTPTHSCFNATVSPQTTWHQDLIRLDHDFTKNTRLSLNYIHDSWDTTVAIPQWAYLVNSFPTVQNDFKGPGLATEARLTQTLSSTLLNQLIFGYTTDHITLTNIPGYNGSSIARTSPAFSSQGYIFNNGFGGKISGIAVGGNNAAYGGTGFNADTSFTPWHHSNPTYTIREEMTKVWNKHTLQFGALLLIAQRNEVNPPVGSVTGDVQGILGYDNLNNNGSSGNAFADLLIGQHIASFQQDSAQLKYYQRYKIAEPYLQDDWHVTPRLTLNLGLRLSLFSNYREKNNNVYNFDPAKFNVALAETMHVDPLFGFLIDNATGSPIHYDLNNLDPRLTNGLVHCGYNGVPSSCINSHVFNPEPRIGFAWSPFKSAKTSIRGGYGIFYEHGTGAEANTGSLEGSAPLVLNATQIFPGTYSGIGNNGPQFTNLAYPLNVTSIPKNTPFAYVQQWSFGFQQELPGHFILGTAYVGSKGTHLTAQLQLNQLQPVPASLNPFGPHEPITAFHTCLGYDPSNPGLGSFDAVGSGGDSFHINGLLIGPGDPAYVNLLAACSGSNQAFPVQTSFPLRSSLTVNAPNLGNITSLQNIANSSYNALQATLRKVAGPLTLSVSYTYSHSLDDSSDRTDASLVNSYDLAANHASSDFDERHALAISYIYQLPLRRLATILNSWADSDPTNQVASKSGPGKFIDGWELSGVIVHQSGTPFSIINGASPNGASIADSAGAINNISFGSYADYNPNAPTPISANQITNSFGPLLGNPNEFVAPRGLTFGDVGRNSFNNPARTNFDTSVFKTVRIGESRSLQFRAETFNTFNHTQFRIFDPNRGNVNNTISCYGGPNYTAGWTPTAADETNCLSGSSFLHPVDAHRPRTVQLGVKFLF
ncbi:MAG TPA: carboxypeptidase regulatory-like domain-containing protein [Candidatus Acidoferrum sp.]|nr:carboxypeptidase regulatory-like domain-containing protein [Candidatus Acidoferrum sp.]